VKKVLFLIAMFATMAATLVFALWITPSREAQGFEAVRLFYFHVPIAIVAYVAFGLTALASVLWLWPRTRRPAWDLLAGASAEVGVVFTALTLVLGAIWGKPTWGVWWAWDARLTTTAILFFLYLGYLALRRTGATADERGKRCAIAAIIAFVDVPINYLSVSWWQTLHQTGTVFNRRLNVKVDGSMALTLLLAFVSFTMLFGYLVFERFQLAELEEGLEERALEIAIAERVRVEEAITVS